MGMEKHRHHDTLMEIFEEAGEQPEMEFRRSCCRVAYVLGRADMLNEIVSEDHATMPMETVQTLDVEAPF